MNQLFSAIALISLLLQPCSESNAQSSIDVSANTEVKTFKIEQETNAFDLEHKEVEPVFQTQQVPDTCYRSVQRGTKTECHTEYDQQCTTRMETECRNVPYPVCQNVPRDVCETVNDRVCRTEPNRICTTVPRRECNTVQQCTTETDRVCQGTPPNQRCQDVPRRVCKPVQQCRTVNDSVCRTENRQVCENVPRRQCHTENRRECRDEYRRECNDVPRQSCIDIPRQACAQVPNMVKEPYACTRDVQVQVGERTKLRVGANVKVVIVNFGRVELNGDEFEAKLIGSDVTLSLGKNDQKTIYRLVKKERTEQAVSENDRQVQVTFFIEMISLDQLTASNAIKVVEPKLTFEKLQFKLSGDLSPMISLNPGHLEVVMVKGRRLYTIIDQSFDPALALRKVGDAYEVSFSSFDVRYLRSRNHQIQFEFNVSSLLNPKELLNPDLLNRVSLQPIRGEFEGFPTN